MGFTCSLLRRGHPISSQVWGGGGERVCGLLLLVLDYFTDWNYFKTGRGLGRLLIFLSSAALCKGYSSFPRVLRNERFLCPAYVYSCLVF